MSRLSLDFRRLRPTMFPMLGGWALLLLAASSLSAATQGAAQPWYARAECHAAQAAVMAAEVNAAKTAIEKLQNHRDLELRACAVWLEVKLSDVEMALEGTSDALLERSRDRLESLFKFAMRYGRQRRHLLDLAIEARMYRVRLMAERDDRAGALSEARKVEKMLASRAEANPTPTRRYARGMVDLGVSQSTWALRVLLKMAGLGGDESRGRRLLEALAEGDTVYRGDALFILHHFARQGSTPSRADTERYGLKLVEAFGQNPQFLFDRAVDQYETGRCEGALGTLAPLRSRLHEEPQLWSARVRKKVYWLTGRCALETGDKPLAQESLGLASREQYGGYAEEVKRLQQDLNG